MNVTDQKLRESFKTHSAWYKHAAERSRPFLLQRNIKQCLQERPSGGSVKSCSARTEAWHDSSPRRGRSASIFRRRPRRVGPRIDDIAHQLIPFYPFYLEKDSREQILKLDVKGIKRGNAAAKASSMTSDVPSGNSNSWSTGCRCEVEIRYLPAGSGAGVRGSQIFRDSQFAKISVPPTGVDEPPFAAIQLNQPFFISESKLMVKVGARGMHQYTIGHEYQLRLRVSIDPKELVRSPLAGVIRTSTAIKLRGRGKVPPLPESYLQASFRMSPGRRGENVKSRIEFFTPEPPENFAKCYLQLDHSWSSPDSMTLISRPLKPRLLTPISEPENGGDKKPLIRYYHHLPQWSFGQGNSKTYVKSGYVCPFCIDRNLWSAKLLQLHWITTHDRFKFRVLSRGELPDPTLGADLYISVTPSNETDYYFDPGLPHLDGWSFVRRSSPTETLARLLEPVLNPSTVPSSEASSSLALRQVCPPIPHLPIRRRRRNPVPFTRPNVMLLRSSTKRVLEVGEVASDSDEEVDESWIKQKHAEIIDDFTDVTSREKEFVKRWDAHVFAERIPANRYVAPSLMRFSYENHDFLQRRDMREEFFKFTSKLILEGTVHPDAVGTCMDIIKSAALPDKSQSSQDSKSASSVTLSSPRRPSQSAMELDHRDIFPPPKLRTDLSKAICPCGKQWKGSNVVICCGPNCPHKYFHDECVGLDGLGKFTRGWKCDVCASTR